MKSSVSVTVLMRKSGTQSVSEMVKIRETEVGRPRAEIAKRQACKVKRSHKLDIGRRKKNSKRKTTKDLASDICRRSRGHATVTEESRVAEFRQNRLNRGRDMAIFRFFKMAAAAILDFENFKFLTVGRSRGSKCFSMPNFIKIG